RAVGRGDEDAAGAPGKEGRPATGVRGHRVGAAEHEGVPVQPLTSLPLSPRGRGARGEGADLPRPLNKPLTPDPLPRGERGAMIGRFVVLPLLPAPGTRAGAGLPRRNFLRAGALTLGGLSLPWLLRTRARAAESAPGFVRDKAVVLIFLAGGASHI